MSENKRKLRPHDEVEIMLHEYYPFWMQWIRWSGCLLDNYERALVEIIIERGKKHHEYYMVNRISKSYMRKMFVGILDKLNSPDYGENYLSFVAQVINLREVPEHEYKLFLEWRNCLHNKIKMNILIRKAQNEIK